MISSKARLRLSVGALALTGALASAGTAIAQSADIITVTAQRREQSVQDVPVAVTAFSGADLRDSSIAGVEGIAERTPGFTMTRFNIGEPQLYIRGIGSTSDSAAGDPSVAVSIDEVYIGRAGGGALSFFDLERVEVLRGPQGTLYGRNAAGGAVNIITARPDATQSFGEFTFGYGDHNDRLVSAVLNGPLGEGAAGRLAFLYQANDGYSQSVPSGADLGGSSTWGLRGAISWDAGDWSFLAQADYARDETDGQARVPVVGPNTNPAFIGLIGAIRAGLNERQSFSSPNTFQERDSWGVLLRADTTLGDMDFTSLTSYRGLEFSWFDDLGGLPVPPYVLRVEDISEDEAWQFTQEFRLSRTMDNGGFWVAGLYLFHEEVDRNERFIVDARAPLPAIASGDVTFFQEATNRSAALFAQVTLPLSDTVNFTAGGRLTYDSKEIFARGVDNQTPGGPFPGIPLGPPPGVAYPNGASGSTSWTEPTWRLALDWQAADNVMLYAAYDRGYKSGLYPSQAQSAAQATTALDPEILYNFEVGMKSTFADGRGIFNIAAFYTDYQSLQVYELLGLALSTSNANAEIRGVEAEFAFQATDFFQFGGSYAYLDAQYTSNAVSNLGVLPYNGNRLTRSPEHQFNVYAAVDMPVASGTARARVDYNWTGDYFFDPSNAPETLVSSYGTVDARLSWGPDHGNWDISLWGRNLTDELYPTHIIKNLDIGFTVFAPPRTFGAQFRVRFGG